MLLANGTTGNQLPLTCQQNTHLHLEPTRRQKSWTCFFNFLLKRAHKIKKNRTCRLARRQNTLYQNIQSGLSFPLFSVLITSLPSQSITRKVIVWLTFSLHPSSNQLPGAPSLSPPCLCASLARSHAHTSPPGDLLERGTAAAHSDTIRTADLIPSCPSTHTFNLLGRLEESLVRCLSDWIFLAPGPAVSFNASTSVCVCVCLCVFVKKVCLLCLACPSTKYSPMHWPIHTSTTRLYQPSR